MTIKDIRSMTGLSQKKFCDMYHIPLSSLHKWETKEGRQNHRECPVYVKELLERAVKQDFKKG